METSASNGTPILNQGTGFKSKYMKKIPFSRSGFYITIAENLADGTRFAQQGIPTLLWL
jgi:hypothetical protein